jgi:hypothetical protein
VAKRIGCKIEVSNPLSVAVADRTKIYSSGVCRQLVWSMQEKEFTADMRLLNLGGCDMVLGIQWLAELRPILWDFKNLWMEFKANGKRCVLQGSPVGPNKTLSDAQMGKTLKSIVQASSAHIFSIRISEQGK